MPRNGKKGQKKNPYVNIACNDVKLADFADSKVSAIRRKPILNSLTREVKDLYAIEKAWFEGGATGLDSCNPDDEEDAYENPTSIRKEKSKASASKPGIEEEGADGVVTYPLDLWFLLAQYIRPEDVNSFASLCKSSYFVTRTYSFWISLYKRYYKSETKLPLRLQSCCIERPHSLKVCVVRALYHFYPRFSSIILSSHSCNVRQLLKFTCVSMWHVQVNKKWSFCFKLKPKSSLSKINLTVDVVDKKPKSEVESSWEASDYVDPKKLLQDVNRNSEEGCKILKVISPHFIASPSVMGAHLADIKLGLARDMIKQKLQMVFSFSNYKQSNRSIPSVISRNCGGSGEVLEFDPVDSIVVMDWWHPQYPTSNEFL